MVEGGEHIGSFLRRLLQQTGADFSPFNVGEKR